MDISQETDVNVLKALAFDTIQRLEIEQQNLRIVQARIAEVQKEEAVKAEAESAKAEEAERTTSGFVS